MLRRPHRLTVLVLTVLSGLGCRATVAGEVGSGVGGAPSTGVAGTGGTGGSALPDPGVRLSKGEPRCVLRGGKVTCYTQPDGVGTGGAGPTVVPGIDDAEEGVAALEQTCVRRASGKVTCWGFNHHGQLGLAIPVESTTATPVDLPMVDVERLATSHHSLCGIAASGQLLCWGGAYSGPIGDPSVSETEAPIPVVSVPDAVDVAMSMDDACAVHAGGTVTCFEDKGSPLIVPGVSDAVKVAVAEPSLGAGILGCALRKGGTVVCWWSASSATSTAVAVPGLSGVAQIEGSVYGQSVCGRTGSGQVFCLGGAGQGALTVQLSMFAVHDAIDLSPGYRGIGVVHADGTVTALDYQGLQIDFPLPP